MEKLLQMLRKRQDTVDAMRSLLNKVDEEHRDLTSSEETEYRSMERNVRKLQLDISEKKDELRAAGITRFPGDGPLAPSIMGDGFSSDNGEEIRMLRPDEKIADHVRYRSIGMEEREGSLSFGRYIRGIVTGDWDGAEHEKRALKEGDDTLGGYLVPSPLSAKIIDLARNASVCMRAGALTIPMESNTLDLAKILQDPTAYWRGENKPITVSDMSFGKLTLKARTLAALVKVSVEVIEDAMNLDQIVSSALSQALALELDRACIFGEGTPIEPLGLYNTEGVQVIDMGENGAALDSYLVFSQAAGKIADANGPEARNLALAMSPREYTEMDGWTDTLGQPLKPTKSYEDMRKFISNQIPTNMTKGAADDASIMIAGDFSQMLVGMRTNIAVKVSEDAADETGSAFTDMQVWIRAYLRADLVVARPPWFCVIDGVIPPAA